MLDIHLFRKSPDQVREALTRRHQDPAPVDEVIALDEQRRALIQQVEELRAERNEGSKEIGRTRDPEERQQKIKAMREIGDQIDRLDEQLSGVEAELEALLSTFPNLPDERVPLGVDDTENELLKAKNFGRKSLDDIIKVLNDMGLDLGMRVDDFDHKYQQWLNRKDDHET